MRDLKATVTQANNKEAAQAAVPTPKPETKPETLSETGIEDRAKKKLTLMQDHFVLQEKIYEQQKEEVLLAKAEKAVASLEKMLEIYKRRNDNVKCAEIEEKLLAALAKNI